MEPVVILTMVDNVMNYNGFCLDNHRRQKQEDAVKGLF